MAFFVGLDVSLKMISISITIIGKSALRDQFGKRDRRGPSPEN
jgi:hypothetical protein